MAKRQYKSNRKKTVYLYQDRKYIGKFDSFIDAAEECGLTPTSIRTGYNEQRTIKGRVFVSNRELTQEEIENIQIDDNAAEIKERKKCSLKPSLSKDVEYQVSCKQKDVCYLPRTREARADLLKDFIYKKLWNRWESINPTVATLEKQFVKELTDSLR